MKKRVYFLCYTLFITLGLISSLYVYQECKSKREATANRNAILSSLSGMFDELSEKIETDNDSAVDYISEFILRCGYLSSLCPKNSACIYDYLSRLRNDKNADKVSTAVYARRCADCILQELKGRVALIERYNESNLIDTTNTQFKQSGSHLQIISGETRCIYNANVYKKYIYSEQEPIEFVDLVDYSGLSDSIGLQSMDKHYLFSDCGIDFYCCSNDTQLSILGLDSVGKVRYYKKTQEARNLLFY